MVSPFKNKVAFKDFKKTQVKTPKCKMALKVRDQTTDHPQHPFSKHHISELGFQMQNHQKSQLRKNKTNKINTKEVNEQKKKREDIKNLDLPLINVRHKSQSNNVAKTENMSNLGAIMKVITKQPARMPLAHQQMNVLDKGFLKALNDGRNRMKANKSSFMHSGSSSIIFGCGNPHLNLMSTQDL